ncbi:MAG TPA: NUDIX domain-containing protein [Bacteroidia bacterium]|nr:NUDIX domain-containing protein [Bacteroidia bacterium]
MYKVFINNHPVVFTDDSFAAEVAAGSLFVRDNSEKVLDEIIQLANRYKDFFNVIYFVTDDPEKMFHTLVSRCRVIEAAGGVVKDPQGETLMIFRRDKWDLPKGKIDPGETPEAAALREVEEECGIRGHRIVKKLSPTYHAYMQNETFVLKKTYWYEMRVDEKLLLTPQAEEGITEVKWMDRAGERDALKNTFHSVEDVMAEVNKKG